MKRTARLVRRALLEGRAAAPDPWIRSAADVAAAVARSGTGPRHEGTAAAGPGGAVVSSRDPYLNAGALVGGSGRRVVHAAGGPGATSLAAEAISSRDVALAAGGPGAISSRDIAHAAGGPSGAISSRALSHATAGGPGGLTSSSGAATGGPPGTMSPRRLARAAGAPGAISSRLIPHGAGGILAPREVDRATGGVIPSRELSYPAGDVIKPHELAHGAGAITTSRDLAQAAGGVITSHELAHGAGAITTSRDLAQAAGGLGGASGHELPHAVLAAGRCSGCDGNLSVVKRKRDQEEEPGEDLEQGLANCDQESSSYPKVCSDTTIHDQTFLSSQKMKTCDLIVDISGGDDEWSTELDFSREITSHLTQCTGPVLSFRINCSKWMNNACLEKWLDLLSVKSVKELELLNLGHCENTVFPLESLRSKNLQLLRIGFFILALDLNCFDYGCLHTLELFSCQFDGNKLSWVINDCTSLQVLKVYHCSVDLHINSKSLEYLDCFGITGNRMVVSSAPNLLRIAYGIMPPKQKSAVLGKKISASASIYLTDVPSLMFMEDLSLAYNTILVNTKDLVKEVVPLHSVVQLNLSVEMSNSRQLQNLCKLLQSFPRLETLDIKRVDNVGRDEAFDIRMDEPFLDIGMLHCVKNCLTSVSIQGFQGGDSEKHLIKCLLKNAPNLIHISTRRYLNASKEIKKAVRYAVNEIRSYERATEGCEFSFE